ncbi:unnamed protein product [Natator depressus]
MATFVPLISCLPVFNRTLPWREPTRPGSEAGSQGREVSDWCKAEGKERCARPRAGTRARVGQGSQEARAAPPLGRGKGEWLRGSEANPAHCGAEAAPGLKVSEDNHVRPLRGNANHCSDCIPRPPGARDSAASKHCLFHLSGLAPFASSSSEQRQPTP